MGYVGFAVAFAFAIAALLEKEVSRSWARWVRPWTTVAWSFLTMGIALGSWWAYYELGWGGWWFWDPVENASLMPWLVGTALIHSLAVTEKRGLFKSWTLLLAIFAFSLSLLGTFLVRSGVLTSVHAFASDPERGFFILIYLLVVVGFSLTLFAFKAPSMAPVVHFSWLSKESLLLLNNVILVVCTGTVLLGTLFPLLLDALDMGLISVGAPYFNTVIVPLVIFLALVLGFGVIAHWKNNDTRVFFKRVRWYFLVSLMLGVVLSTLLGDSFQLSEMFAIAAVSWILLAIIKDVFNKTQHRGLLSGMKKLTPAYYGMHIAHLGFALAIIGVVVSSGYSEQKDARMTPGTIIHLGDYQFRFDGVEQREGPNYLSDYGTISVFKNKQKMAVMHPEKRLFTTQNRPMTEVAIDAGVMRDLYVALGEPLDADGSWAVRLHVKPFVRWIWLGALLMALGGLVAIMDKRYRRSIRRKNNDSRAEKRQGTSRLFSLEEQQ